MLNFSVGVRVLQFSAIAIPFPQESHPKNKVADNPTKRTKSIKVYVFDDEKIAIENKATATGVTASEYLRSCGLKRVLATKPPADLITIRATVGTLKSELMMLKHLAVETNNQQIINSVEIAIALADKTIVFRL
ncbi:MobB protein [Tolypothrix bouteillei VB521301_2]|uniref:plasmid mobilization protein n=1 Tax=Tolypothrix bouteillei TaxID=1246981 RepID=UPI0038B4F4C3